MTAAGRQSAPGNSRPGKGRRRLTRALVVLGSIFAFFAMLSVWVERQALHTDDWVGTSSEMLNDPSIRSALSDYLVDELYENVDMEREIENILPEEVGGLAGPAAGGLRQGAGELAIRVLETGTAQELWESANRTAHSELVDVLEGGNERVSTEEGVVTLDLAQMLRDLATQIGIGESIANQIPEDAAEIVVLRSDELETAQDVTQAVKGLALLFTILALASFGGAVALSRGQRWIPLLGTAIGLIAASFAILVLRSVAGGIVVDQLVTDPSVIPAAESAWAIGTSLLVGIATSVIVFGIALAIAAWLASPTSGAETARRAMAPGLRDHTPYFYAGIVVLLGMYLLVSGSHNVRSFVTAIAIAALAAVGVRGLEKTTHSEFPDVPAWKVPQGLRSLGSSIADSARNLPRRSGGEDDDSASGGPTREPVRDFDGDDRGSDYPDATNSPAPRVGGEDPQPAARPDAPEDFDTRMQRLERLADLHDRGVLTDEELAREKSRIFGE